MYLVVPSGGSSQNSDGVTEDAEVLRGWSDPTTSASYIYSDDEDEAPEVEVEEEFIPPLSSDNEDDEDGSVFHFEDGNVYLLSSDDEEEDLDHSLQNYLWLIKVSRHGLDFFEAWKQSHEEEQKSSCLSDTWITICWKVIMDSLPNDATNTLPTGALILLS